MTPAETVEAIRGFLLEMSAPAQVSLLRCHLYSLVHVDPATNVREQVTIDAMAENLTELGQCDELRRSAHADRIAIRFAAQAAEWSRGLSRTQRFAIAAQTSNEPDVGPVNQYYFTVDPPNASGLHADEGPSEKGFGSLSMRLNEVLGKQALEAIRDGRKDSQMCAEQMKGVLELTMRRNEFLEERCLQLSERLQEAADRRVSREIEAYARKLEVEREDRMWRAAEAAIPKILDKWGAGPLGAFIKSFTKDEMKALIAACPPEKKALLLEALDVHLGMHLLERNSATANGVEPS